MPSDLAWKGFTLHCTGTALRSNTCRQLHTRKAVAQFSASRIVYRVRNQPP